MNYATDTSPIVVDVETCGLDNAADYLEPVVPDARLKDPAKIEADIADKTATRLTKIGLDYNVGRIVALGWWCEPDGVQAYLCRDEDGERAAVERFWALSAHRTIVGFCCKSFDLRYLIQRSRLLGLTYPQLNLSKYSNQGIEDLYLMLTFGDGPYDQGAMRRTLHAFCRRFGIPVTDQTTGKDIAALVATGDWAAVEAHVTADVILTLALARRLGVVAPALERGVL